MSGTYVQMYGYQFYVPAGRRMSYLGYEFDFDGETLLVSRYWV